MILTNFSACPDDRAVQIRSTIPHNKEPARRVPAADRSGAPLDPRGSGGALRAALQ